MTRPPTLGAPVYSKASQEDDRYRVARQTSGFLGRKVGRIDLARRNGVIAEHPPIVRKTGDVGAADMQLLVLAGVLADKVVQRSHPAIEGFAIMPRADWLDDPGEFVSHVPAGSVEPQL